MKHQDKRFDEIINTLEQIEKANQMIAYHKEFKEVDGNAVENFQRLRKDFMEQLAELLKGFEVEVKLPIAA